MGLVVSELMYHPAEGGGTYEFIELYNNRAVFEDLTGYSFTNGIRYVFELGTIIGPKEYLVVACDPTALEALAELVNGPWQTSYGARIPPTAFDRFLDASADALNAEGLGSGRRDGIKQFVRDRRAYILKQIPNR